MLEEIIEKLKEYKLFVGLAVVGAVLGDFFPGGHDAAAVAGEEDGVDQLRFAARELGHKGDGDFFRAQLLLHLLQPLGGGI